MSKEKSESKAVRVPTFNGDKGLFQTWWIRFRAYAKVAKFTKALGTEPEPDLPASQAEAEALTGSSEETKKKLAAVDRNDDAMANLTLAFTTDELISMILASQTAEWPEGLACNVIKELIKKYKPDDVMSLVDEKIALNKIRMSSSDEPSVLFDQITAVEVRYNTKTKKISEAEKIAVVLSQAPKMYQSVLTSEQRIKRQLGHDVTIDDLKEVMEEHYRLLSSEDHETEETALQTNDNRQSGNNYKRNGRSGKYRRKKRFDGNCNNCGLRWHKAADCWHNDKNASRRPGWWKKTARNIETSAIGFDGTPEIVLPTVDTECDIEDDNDSEDSIDFAVNQNVPPKMIMLHDDWSSSDDSSTPPPPLFAYTPGDSSDEDESEDETSNAKELPLPLSGCTWGSLCGTEASSHVKPNKVYYNGYESDSSGTGTMPDLMKRSDESSTTSLEDKLENKAEHEWENLIDESDETEETEETKMSTIPFEIEIVSQSETAMPNMEIPANFGVLNSPEVWIADTGATVHNTPHAQGISNIKKPSNGDQITVGNGDKMLPVAIGDIQGTVTSKDGCNQMKVVLKNVVHTPTSKYNLLSLTKLMSEGWTLKGGNNSMKIVKNNQEINFDIIIRTKRGQLYCVNIQRQVEYIAAAFEINRSKAHNILGHSGDDATLKTAKALGWKVSGPVIRCESCQAAKAKQKPVPKLSKHVPSTIPGERFYMDISIIKKPAELKYIGKSNWFMIVDEATLLKFSNFYQSKNHLVQPTCVLVSKLKSKNIVTKYIRCDNAGENKSLEKEINGRKWKSNIQFEYTSRDTPQQNSLVETSFTHILNKARALMIEANVPYLERYKIVQEAVLTATKLDGLVINDGASKTRYELFGLPIPKFVQHLRTWGEAGVVKIKTKTTPKLSNKGETCMFVGYADDHDGDCYRMWRPNPHFIYQTRDVIWLKRMYFSSNEKPSTSPDQIIEVPTTAAGERMENEAAAAPNQTTANPAPPPEPPSKLKVTIGGVEVMESDSESSAEEEEDEMGGIDKSFLPVGAKRSRTGRTIHPRTYYHHEYQGVCTDDGNYYGILGEESEDDESEDESENAENEIANVGAGIGGGYEHSNELKPLNYKQAMKSKDKMEWIKEIKKENERMKKYNVWKPVPKKSVPTDVVPLTSTWAFKKKSTGNRRGRLNAHGFKQKPGKHFKKDSISSPVTNEVTIRVVLVIMLVLRLLAGVLDVKGAFLQGEFAGDEEQIYMQVPDGLEEEYGNDVYLKLLAPIYGLRNASIAFYRKLKKCMKGIGCSKSMADPCLHYAWRSNLMIWLSWIDDCLYCGDEKDIKHYKDKLMQKLDCEDEGQLNEYVGVKIEKKQDRLKLTQPVLVQSLQDEFEIPDRTPCALPAPNGKELSSEGELLDEEEKRIYRSGVGKLLFLMRYSRPDILNAVRELSKWMSDGATIHHKKVMLQTMNYILHTRNRGLHLNPIMGMSNARKEKFIVKGRCDSNYATNEETRKSVSGIEVTLNGAPVVMRSVGQKIVALSVTEAELIALAQAVQEMLYVMRLLESMQLQVQKPMIVECDNKGAVDICNTWTVGGRTKHIDTRYYFLRELKEEGVLEFHWIEGKRNSTDLFTKNLPNPLFTKHTGYYCTDEDFSVKE